MQTSIKLNDELTLFADWHGGPYIDLYVNGWGSGAKEVINVWDYGKGESSIPFTREAMRAKIHSWVHSYGEDGIDSLIHDIKEHWLEGWRNRR